MLVNIKLVRRDFCNKFFAYPLTAHVLHASMHNQIKFESFICWFCVAIASVSGMIHRGWWWWWYLRASAISMQRTSCTQSTRSFYVHWTCNYVCVPIQIMHIFNRTLFPFSRHTHTRHSTGLLEWEPGRHTTQIQFHLLYLAHSSRFRKFSRACAAERAIKG